jgi:flagellar biosynthesis anti-sigma factor FlgM
MAPSESNSVAIDNVTDLTEARRARQTGKTSAKPKNRRFNKEKVEQIKAAIADGSYKIDAERVADKFIERERT